MKATLSAIALTAAFVQPAAAITSPLAHDNLFRRWGYDSGTAAIPARQLHSIAPM